MSTSQKTGETKNQPEGNIPSTKRRSKRSKVEATDQPDMTPGTNRFMQRYLGNRAMASITAQRKPLDQIEDHDPRIQRAEPDEELEYPGPRRENVVQQRGATIVSAPSPIPSGATDLDGEGLYGWDRLIVAQDVATVVNGVIPTGASQEEMPRIIIFSGTHGNPAGHLINDSASRGFVAEDQATADAANTANPGAQVEVIDVVNSNKTKNELTAIYGMTDCIRILGWCFSKLSYGLGDNIKSNWWQPPDRI